jgi:hypothetical protein
MPEGLECSNGVANLYANMVTTCARLQVDTVKLLEFLMSEYPTLQQEIPSLLDEFFYENPTTPLQLILQSMGSDGVVTFGVGSIGPGVGLVIDNSFMQDDKVN